MPRDLEVRVTSSWPRLIFSASERLLDRWSRRPAADFIPVGLILAVHVAIVSLRHYGEVLRTTAPDQRLAIYGAGAGVTSLIAGFAGTAIAQYGSSSGPIVSALRQAHGRAIRRNWISITSSLLLSATLCLVAMVAGSAKNPHGSQWIFEAALLIAMIKFCRLIFLFSLILRSVDEDSREPYDEDPVYKPREIASDDIG